MNENCITLLFGLCFCAKALIIAHKFIKLLYSDWGGRFFFSREEIYETISICENSQKMTIVDISEAFENYSQYDNNRIFYYLRWQSIVINQTGFIILSWAETHLTRNTIILIILWFAVAEAPQMIYYY